MKTKNFLYGNFKKNEVVRPTFYTTYWVILVCLLLAIISSFLVIPVSAWEEVSSFNAGVAGTNFGMHLFDIRDASKWTQVTRFTGTGFKASSYVKTLEGTYRIKHGADATYTYYGYAYLKASVTEANNANADCDIEVTIINWTGSPPTQSIALVKIENTQSWNYDAQFVSQHSGIPINSISENPFAVGNRGTPTFSSITSGTWKTYTGTVPDANANFTGTPTIGAAPLSVSFDDISEQASENTLWTWNYGDGQIANGSTKNPTHVYNNVGVYTVRMDAYSPFYGWWNTTKANYINVTSPAEGTLLPGSTRTTVYATDGNTGTKLIGATLNVRDVENSSWVNSTSSMAGSIIDVITGHTLDIYGSYPGVYTASSELGATPGGNYYLPLYPPLSDPGPGFKNLVVGVYEAGTGLSIPYASVSVRTPAGATTGDSTGISGSAYFVVPNQTTVTITVSKAGYNGQTTTKTILDEDVFQSVTLSRATMTFATPTTYTTNPEGTIVPVQTIDGRTIDEKSQGIMDDTLSWFMILIPIAGIMTLLYLMGYKP